MTHRTNAQTGSEQGPLRRLLSRQAAKGGVTRTMQATWRGEVIAEGSDTLVVEGNHYFPPGAVRSECLRPSNHRSVCPWKGTASYYDVVVDGQVNRNAAWFYPEPNAAARHIAGRIAFWRGVKVHPAE
jgi:uncharacterized protein (DUF427 family)